MNKLTKYWREKKYALTTLLAAVPACADKTTVQAWFDNITNKPTPETSPESLLEKALDSLAAKRANATDKILPTVPPRDNPNRRSKRLLGLVQGAVGDVDGGGGFTSCIGDIHPGGGGGGAPGQYFNEASAASFAAANFLSAVKSEIIVPGTGLAAVLASLRALWGTVTVPPVDPFVLESIGGIDGKGGLIGSMDNFLKNGGGGVGSGYWPSTIISSSSGG